jgi:hypothetical protein
VTAEESVETWRKAEAVRRGLLREVNERIASLSRNFARQERISTVQLICECGDRTCKQPVEVTLAAYDRVRADPRRYLIAVNHEDPETETVIAVDDRHAVVETLAGNASKLAEITDPRRRARLSELVRDRSRTLDAMSRPPSVLRGASDQASQTA